MPPSPSRVSPPQVAISISSRPASLHVIEQLLEVDAHRAAGAPAGGGGAHAGCRRASSASRTACLVAACRCRAAAGRARTSARRRRAPRRAASGVAPMRGHLARAAAGRRCRRTWRAWPPRVGRRPRLGQHDVGHRGDRRPIRRAARRRCTSPARAPTSTSPACCDAAISAMRTISSPTLPRPPRGPQAEPAEQQRDAGGAGGRTGSRTRSRCRRRASPSRAAAPCRVSAAATASTLATIAPSMSSTACGGCGSRSRSHMVPSAWCTPMPRMLPISASAESAISGSPGPTPRQPSQRAPPAPAGRSAGRSRRCRRRTGSATAVTCVVGLADGVHRVGQRQRERGRHRQVDRAAEHAARAPSRRCPSRCSRSRGGRRAGCR